MNPHAENIIMLIIMLGLIMCVVNFCTSNEATQENVKRELTSQMNKNLNDKYTKYYADLCKEINAYPNGQVSCVMTATQPIYHYTAEQDRKELRTPSEYAMMGGNCKDSALFYATIFKNLNYTITFRFPVPHHISLTINKKIDNETYQYCDIEGNKATCYEVRI